MQRYSGVTTWTNTWETLLLAPKSGGEDWLFRKLVLRLDGDASLLVLAAHNFPEIAVCISEVAAVPTPLFAVRWLDNLAARAFGLGQHCSDALVGAEDVAERDAVKAATVR